MRLAALKRNYGGNKIFKLAEDLAISLLGILTVATNENELVWKHLGCNVFSAEFQGLALAWDQPNNEPPSLIIASRHFLQDNGSGAYGFEKLSAAIQNQFANQTESRKH